MSGASAARHIAAEPIALLLREIGAGRAQSLAALDAIDLDSDTEPARAAAYLRAARAGTAQK